MATPRQRDHAETNGVLSDCFDLSWLTEGILLHRITRHWSSAPVFIALLVAACAHEREDVAEVCLTEPTYDDGEMSLSLEENQPISFFVTASAGCHQAELAVSCVATVSGDQITVTTETSWVRTEPFATSCEMMLLLAHSSCETPPMESGTYTITYGDKVMTVEVPGSATGCL